MFDSNQSANAADAGASDVQAELLWGDSQAKLTVCDNGSGFVDSLLDVLGSEAISSYETSRA